MFLTARRTSLTFLSVTWYHFTVTSTCS